MAKQSGKRKGRKLSTSGRKTGAGRRATSQAAGGKRRAAGAKTPKGKARRKQTSAKKGRSASAATRSAAASTALRRKGATAGGRKGRRTLEGGGRKETLAQRPQTGRTRKGWTNPMPPRRSTGSAAGAGTSRSGRLERERKVLREIEEGVPTPPSSLDMDRAPSAARSGRQKLHDAREDHPETSPVMTGGDVDADWEDAYSIGDEAPGGDNPTPDQDRVDDIGKALGVTYEDNEELKASDKIADRDRHRWELDPASSEDYRDRD